MVAEFVEALYKAYVDLFFTYLEINPLVITGGKIYMLDLAAKLDATADFICRGKWGEIEYPPPFGRDAYPEEAYIADLDAKSGASLKVRVHIIYAGTLIEVKIYEQRVDENNGYFVNIVDFTESSRTDLDDGSWWWSIRYLQ
jgi:hypothetical protein